MSEVVSKLERAYLDALYEYLWEELVPADVIDAPLFPTVSRTVSRLSSETSPNIMVAFSEHRGVVIVLDMGRAVFRVQRWWNDRVWCFELCDPRCFERILGGMKRDV